MATDYQANIDALEEALGSGELIVQMPDGRRVEYRSVAELKAAVAYARQMLATGGGVSKPKSRSTYAGFARD